MWLIQGDVSCFYVFSNNCNLRQNHFGQEHKKIKNKNSASVVFGLAEKKNLGTIMLRYHFHYFVYCLQVFCFKT